MDKKETNSTLSADEILIHILKDLTFPVAMQKQGNNHIRESKLLTQANLHGVIPQVFKVCSLYPDLYQEEMQVLKKSYTYIVQANLLLTGHLLTVCKALEDNDFNYLCIKGPTLSHLLYNDISMRQFSDIDVCVAEEEIYAISELLISLGFVPVLPLSLLKRKKFLELDNDFSFRHQKSNALIELHWKLFPLRHHMPLDFKKLHAKSETVILQKRSVTTLCLEDNLLYLSLHGAKHIFERYEWVYDLHTLISNTEVDVYSVYEEAKRANIDRPFLLGIFLSQSLFNTALPSALEKHKSPHIQRLIDKTLDYYTQGFVHWDESDKKRARFLFLSELFQNKESKTLWLFKSLFKTTPVDVITFNLPDSLAFLYPVLRPFRLLYKLLFIKKPQYA